MTNTNQEALTDATGVTDDPHRDHAWRDRGVRLLRGVGPVDTFAAVVAAVGLFALAPRFYAVNNPRQALLLATVPLGLVLLVRGLRRREAPYLVAVALVVLAVVAGARSDIPTVSIVGSMSNGMSAVLLLFAFGWWAIGRELSPRGITLVISLLTLAIVPNVLIGFLQLVFDPSVGIYSASGGRASGLMSNPVYYASVLVGVWAYWFVTSSSARDRTVVIAPAVAVAIGTTGSRGAMLGALVVMTVWLLWTRRRTVAVATAANFAGLVAGVMLLSVFGDARTERFQDADSGGGVGARIGVWRATVEAWLDRPFLGWGFDPHLHAVNERLTESYVRDNEFFVWTDPHNVLLLVLVSLGAVGMIGFVAFAVTSLRGQRNAALIAAAAACAMSWMLQPVTVNSWPLFFLFLGAAARTPSSNAHPAARDATVPDQGNGEAAPDDPPREPAGEGTSPVEPVAIGVGLVLGVAFVVWSLVFAAALRGGAPESAESRALFFDRDPNVRLVLAESYTIAAERSDATARYARAEELALDALDRGAHPRVWVLLVRIQLSTGRVEDGFATAQRWTETRPNDPFAYRWLATTAALLNRDDVEQEAVDKLCRLDDPACELATTGS